jgi:DNA invertase Pin-like site-specific DNA recombinase
MDDAKKRQFSLVIVSAADRFGRDTLGFLTLIQELDQSGVSLVSLRENLDFTTPIGRAFLSIVATISSLEVELTRERIRTALRQRKIIAEQTGNGWKCGRPQKLTGAVSAQIIRLRSEGLSIREIWERIGRIVSRASVGAVVKREHCSSKNFVQLLRQN